MRKQDALWLGGAAVVVVIIGFVAWSLRHPKEEPPPPPAQTAAPAPQKPADATLPPAAQSDAQIRKLLAALSPRPELAQWLADEGLLDRWVVTANNLAEGVSPRKQLGFLKPAKPFLAKGSHIDPRSYQRFDTFADVVASVDAKGFAAAVHELHPLLEAAYHQLGYPDKSVDDLARAALQRLIDAPVIEGDVAIAPAKGALYKFADEKLEAKGEVEKQLLRMGPRNTKLVQAKAREIAAALDLRLAAH
jgi:hypothetical protein